MLNRIRIGTRLSVIVAIAMVGCIAIGSFGLMGLRTNLYEDRRDKTREHVEAAISVISHYHRLAQDGTLSEEEAQATALNVIGDQRYAGEEYFFVLNDRGDMLMHGANRSLNGQNLMGLTDPNGVRMVAEMVDIVAREGAGFVDYSWPKADAAAPSPKISYVEEFTPWGWAIATGIYVDDVNEVFWTYALTDGGFAALVMIVISGIAIVVTRSITRPLASLTSNMNRLARDDKDFTVQFTEYQDELGELARSLSTFRDNAEEMDRLKADQAQQEERAAAQRREDMVALAGRFEASVLGIVNEVSTASTELTGTAETMTSIASTTRDQSEHVASASEEASTNVQTVAAAAEELASSITEISRQISQSNTVTQRAASEAATANTQVQGLANAVGKIGEIVQLINSIAEQTNLLALNATIEAARAGDAGKGFAVVASEVKTLANQTAKATEEISAQIAGVQTATGESVAAIQRINDIVQEINETSASIASAVEEQGAATQEITRNVQKTAEATQLVSSNISGVRDSALETGESAEHVFKASSGLSQGAGRLNEEVANFLDSVRAA